jgi:hypothetical protein
MMRMFMIVHSAGEGMCSIKSSVVQSLTRLKMRLAFFGLLNVPAVINNPGSLVMTDFPRFNGNIFQGNDGMGYLIDSKSGAERDRTVDL